MKHTRLSIAIASAVALAVAPFAAAVPTLYFDFGNNGSIEAVVADGSAGDSLALAGFISAFYTDTLITGSATGATKPALGTSTAPELSETTLLLSGTGTLAIYFSEDGYGPTSQGYVAQLSITSLAPTASVAYTTYATAGPTAGFLPVPGPVPVLGLPMTSQSLAIVDGYATGGVLPFDGTTTVPFSLTQKLVISQPLGGSTSLTANLKVPDGGTTLALLGGSLLGLGAIRRKLVKG